MAADRVLQSLSDRILELDGQIRDRAITYEDTVNFVNSKKNAATSMKTKSDLKKVNEWLRSDGESREIENIEPEQLDIYLSRLLLSIRNTKTDKELEPTTLQGIYASVRRYLVDKSYPEDLTTSDKFRHSRNTLKAKAKDLKQKGLGNKTNRADRFTGEEIDELYRKELLGGSKLFYF